MDLLEEWLRVRWLRVLVYTFHVHKLKPQNYITGGSQYALIKGSIIQKRACTYKLILSCLQIPVDQSPHLTGQKKGLTKAHGTNEANSQVDSHYYKLSPIHLKELSLLTAVRNCVDPDQNNQIWALTHCDRGFDFYTTALASPKAVVVLSVPHLFPEEQSSKLGASRSSWRRMEESQYYRAPKSAG